MPPVDPAGLRACQTEAVAGLEHSLARGDPRALIHMATGAGKTWLACAFIYRLIKHAGARRVLFLVDRNNLGDQTLTEFHHYVPPDDNRPFHRLYVVQHLKGAVIDRDAKVVITTIQRLYATLRGEELPAEAEERSAFEEPLDGPPAEVAYNPALPIESFDFVVTDECHRSIYGRWRQVLDYFDAFIIGLTATPSIHTLGFFNRNKVAEYPYERSVVDGVNVDFEVYRIRTRIGDEGGAIPAGYEVPVMDRRTRQRRYEELDAELAYEARQLDRSVTAPNQIRLVLETFRDQLPRELFPGRELVPKTLIFAKDDSHAETITGICREVFGKGNDFCKKITYRTEDDPRGLIKAFRYDHRFRIAVTVDMIATGTDVKPLEVLIFLRDVKSDLYFEQMKGRGVRTIATADLLQATPDAKEGKQRFIVIDAVGVTESRKNVMQPLERARTVSFEKLLEYVAAGDRREETLTSLARRLAMLDGKLEPEARAKVEELAGRTLREIATGLLDATDPDRVEAEVARRHGPLASEAQRDAVALALRHEAAAPLERPALRDLLKELKARSELVIDEISTDEVLSIGFDLALARDTAERFGRFLEQHKDELTALRILYGRPARAERLTYAALTELADKFLTPPWALDTAHVWAAYRRLDAARVRGDPLPRVLTELVALVRFASGGEDAILESFAVGVEQRFNLWLGRQKKAGHEYTPEQIAWLQLIKRFVAENAEVTVRDLLDAPSFTHEGGLVKAQRLFGRERLPAMLRELGEVLVA
jgi:type I restriction enzyme R subunit